MREERELIAAIGQLTTGYGYDTVIGAAANIMLNALRQKHPRHIDAEEQFEAAVEEMRKSLRDQHYHENGTRNERRIIIPPLHQLVRM